MIASLRIVVADDEPDMQDYLETVLPRLGHTVVAAVKDGQQLIDACRKHSPDLIITDIRMPSLDGDRAVKDIWRRDKIPVILISAYGPADDNADLQGDGVCHRLRKPFKRQDLVQAIEHLFADGRSPSKGAEKT